MLDFSSISRISEPWEEFLLDARHGEALQIAKHIIQNRHISPAAYEHLSAAADLARAMPTFGSPWPRLSGRCTACGLTQAEYEMLYYVAYVVLYPYTSETAFGHFLAGVELAHAKLFGPDGSTPSGELEQWFDRRYGWLRTLKLSLLQRWDQRRCEAEKKPKTVPSLIAMLIEDVVLAVDLELALGFWQPKPRQRRSRQKKQKTAI